MAKIDRVGVIDIGFTKIRTLVAEEEVPGQIRIIGFSEEKPNGFKNGIIVHLEEALSTMRDGIEKIERIGIKFKKLPIYVGIQGNYLKYTRTHTDIRRKNQREKISEAEIKQVKKEAQSMKPPPDERFLHLVPLSYSLDDMKGIQNPKNFRDCHRLGIEGLIIHYKSLVLSNLEQLLDKLAIKNWRFVFQPLAAGLLVAEPEERNLGFALVDLGGWTVLSIYKDGELQHFSVVEMGGEQLTNDLSIGLRIPKDFAEEVKEKYGSIKSFLENKEEMVPLPTTASEEKYCPRRVIAEIMELRLEEILIACREEIDNQGYTHNLLSGVILIGGGAKIPGIETFASQILALPVRIGIPRGMPEEFSQPNLASTLGLVRFAFSRQYEKYSLVEEEGFLPNIILKARQGFEKFFHIAHEE
jgi:cell division protein FtsA